MFYYSKRQLNTITLIATSMLCILVFNIFPENNKVQTSNVETVIVQEESKTNEIIENAQVEENIENVEEEIWQLEIPKIELSAQIAEGTDEETMNKYIGHFTETSKQSGNIGLAAHNRGYQVNYFSRLKELEKYDVIIYMFNESRKIYIVESIQTISETDWSYLQETEENKLTLITCVENRPTERLCIQAKQIL